MIREVNFEKYKISLFDVKSGMTLWYGLRVNVFI